MFRTSRTAIVPMLVLFLVWALATPGQAAELNPLTVRDCLDLAVQNNSDVKAAQASIQKAESVLTQAQSGHYPQINLGARYMKLNESVRFENFTMTADAGGGPMAFQIEKFEISDDKMLIGEAMVEMPIFTWNKISNYRHMAEKGVDVEETRLKALHDRLRFDVVSAYKTVVLAKEARRTLLEVIDEMELFSKTANQDFEDGASNAPQKDILQVQYDLNDMKTWLPELDKWESLSLEALKIAIGEDRGTTVEIIGDTLEYPQVQFDLDALVGKALENRAEIRMLEKAIEVSELQKNVAKVSNLPMFGVFGKYTHTADDFEPNQENQWVIGVGATMALFDGLKSVGMYKEADADRIKRKHQLAQARKGYPCRCRKLSPR